MKKASSVTRSKTLDLEERMVVHGEPVQAEHAEDGAERGEEDAQLERDRNEGGPGEERFAADHEGVGAGVDPPLQAEPERGARQSHDEDDPGKRGAPESHRSLEAVDGERRVGVPPGEARVTHPLARVIEVRRRREFGEDSVVGPLREPRDEERHQEAPSGAGSGRRRDGRAARWSCDLAFGRRAASADRPAAGRS